MKLTALSFIIMVLFSAVSQRSCSDTLSKASSYDLEGQPYETISEWDIGSATIGEQGWCGPTSLYLVIYYYGDQDASYYYRVISSSGFYKWGDDMIDIPDFVTDTSYDISNSSFGSFIQGDSYGSGWTLLDNVGKLYYTKSIYDPVYDVFTCSAPTADDDVDVRERRLQAIYDQALTKNVPVIVHLESGILGYGHYIILIGYDPDEGVVLYVDPLNIEDGILSVTEEDFVENRFYNSGWLYHAKWDGEWIAFWHHGDDIVCDSCEASSDISEEGDE